MSSSHFTLPPARGLRHKVIETKLPLLSSRALDPEEESSLLDHIAVCARCQSVLASHEALDAAVRDVFKRTGPPGPPLTLDDIIGASECSDSTPDPRPVELAAPRSGETAPPRQPILVRSLSSLARSTPNALSSSLRMPDATHWRHEPYYSRRVADCLKAAYDMLKRAPGDVASFVQARAYVERCAEDPMSIRQRMVLTYVMALSDAASERFRVAITRLDQVADLAIALQDQGACAEVMYLLGSILGTVGQCNAAAEHLRIAVEALHSLHEAHSNVDPAFELDVLVALAAQEVLLAHHQVYARLIDDVCHLTASSTSVVQADSPLRWISLKYWHIT